MRIRFAAIFAAILTVVGLSAAPASADVWWLQYTDTSTRLCIDAQYDAQHAYWWLQEATCKTPVGSGAAGQVYQIVPSGTGAVWIMSGVPGPQCVAIGSGSAADDTVGLADCPGTRPIYWDVEWQVSEVSENPNGSVNVMFQSTTSGKCITGAGSGVRLVQQACDSTNPHQVWRQHLKEGCPRCLAARRD
ncbi:RICIN domain-containing protein [Amycolatopsis vancoresmycina]|uniref:Uncharacterized protein n=1 Tax=Amycolatopsis vancoresmycina DSM 44592 TaxID=1292037 RepID=R1I1F9_9PSEU|nr:hypothetical protein [Amycolatopsis vancoresmycina]EOD64299.1 hypothetical protein H480_32548 [Amycolatopsis vancoresmycina DSM 44592]